MPTLILQHKHIYPHLNLKDIKHKQVIKSISKLSFISIFNYPPLKILSKFF